MSNETSPVAKPDPTINVKEMIDTAIGHLDNSLERETHRIDHAMEFETKRVDEKFENVNEKFKDIDVKYQIQFNAAKEALGIALIAQEKGTAAALDGTKEAINKAEVATDKRFQLLSEKIDGVSEILSKNSGAQGIYVTHSDLQTSLDRLQANIEITLRPVVAFMNASQGGKAQVSSVWGYVVGAISLIITIILFAVKFTGN